VSLLAAEDIEMVRRKLPDILPGAFAENVVVSGLDFHGLGLGSRIRLGKEAVLTVTQIGKACHAPCRIAQLTGDCIMPRQGLFATVDAGGDAEVGEGAEVEVLVPRTVFQVVVLTISDRCFRREAQDTAGPAVAARLEEVIGAHVFAAEIIPDERKLIADRVMHWSAGHSIDLVVTVGGTGVPPRDVTPEAVRDGVGRLPPGLEGSKQSASSAKPSNAVLSRGVSEIRGSTLIVSLPGSRQAAMECLEAILPTLHHGLSKLRGDPADRVPQS
jgi:molybdenum cofactor synthesis domain-containing protein